MENNNMKANAYNKYEAFRLVEVSKLSVNDKIFTEIDYYRRFYYDDEVKFEKTRKFFRETLECTKVKDFYRPIHYPTIDESGNICYVLGNKPAFYRDNTYEWWENQAKAFYPEYNSRIGSFEEERLFVIALVKDLVEKGWYIEIAWRAVIETIYRTGSPFKCCGYSKYLSYAWNFNGIPYKFKDQTCTSDMCGSFELSYARKLLKSNEFGRYSLTHISERDIDVCYYGHKPYYAWIIYDAK